MGRPLVFSADVKTRIVLAVLSGETSISQAARKEQVSEQVIGRWKADFLEAGKTAFFGCYPIGEHAVTLHGETVPMYALMGNDATISTTSRATPRPPSADRMRRPARAGPARWGRRTRRRPAGVELAEWLVLGRVADRDAAGPVRRPRRRLHQHRLPRRERQAAARQQQLGHRFQIDRVGLDGASAQHLVLLADMSGVERR